MRATYNVTMTDTEIDRFDPNTTSRSILESISIDPREAALARKFLEDTAIGTQLHAHFQGRQLAYKNAETGETFTFKHTYVKYAEGRIAAKPTRNSLLAAGASGQAKLLIDIKTGEHIVAKEFFTGGNIFQTPTRSEALTCYYARITHTQNLSLSFNGQISEGIAHKYRNPFKKLLQKIDGNKPLNIIYGDVIFSFQITPKQKIEAEKINEEKKQALELAIQTGKKCARNEKSDQDNTKPIIYSEYRGYDLI